MEKDDLGRYVIELSESAAILVEQIQDEITVVIANVVNVHFELTADQALELSCALVAAAAEAGSHRLAADCALHRERQDQLGSTRHGQLAISLSDRYYLNYRGDAEAARASLLPKTHVGLRIRLAGVKRRALN
jgi:hypothetical protein